MRILVTGARGFVGRWMVTELRAAGHEVLPDLDDAGARLDVTNGPDVKRYLQAARPDAVVHLAAIARPADVADDPERAYRVNVEGTRNVVTGLAAAWGRLGAPPVLLVSGSSEVYGSPKAADLPLREESPLQPRTPYARTKVAQEAIALELGAAAGLRVIAVRAFNHTGPGQRPIYAVPAFAKQILDAMADGRPTFPVGDLEVRRDLTDVRDVAVAYRRLVEVAWEVAPSMASQVVNVASGRAITLRDVVANLIELAGANLRPVTDPSLLRPGESAEIRGDPSRVRDLTGWRPTIPLDRTLRDVLEAAGPPAPEHPVGP